MCRKTGILLYDHVTILMSRQTLIAFELWSYNNNKNLIDSHHLTSGVLRRRPHRRQDLAILPFVGTNY